MLFLLLLREPIRQKNKKYYQETYKNYHLQSVEYQSFVEVGHDNVATDVNGITCSTIVGLEFRKLKFTDKITQRHTCTKLRYNRNGVIESNAIFKNEKYPPRKNAN